MMKRIQKPVTYSVLYSLILFASAAANAVPMIDIEKFTNGVNGDTEDQSPIIAPGDNVGWTYLVTNTGDIGFSFANIEIIDDSGSPGDPLDDFGTSSGDIVLDLTSDTGADGILSAGESWLYEAYGIAQDLAGLVYENFATVTATPPIGTGNGPVTDTDLSHYGNPSAAAPEPATIALLVLGLAGIIYQRRRNIIPT